MGTSRKERTGWISVERAIFDHDFFAIEPMSEREAFIWMIARAAYKDTRHRVGSKMMDVPRGSFFVTQREMQREWRWKSLTRVQNFLSRLEEEGMIRSEKRSGKSQVTICNYRDYQAHEVKGKSGESQPEVTKVINKQITDDGETRPEPEICPPSPPPLPDDATDRERLLLAIGHDASGVTAGGKFVGNMGDMMEAARWRDDLGLTLDEQCAVIRDVMRRKSGSPPATFKYFTKPMQEHAGRKSQPALVPTEGEHHGSAPRGPRRGTDAKSTAVTAFVEG